jgi:Zn-dependent protease with chaperone function
MTADPSSTTVPRFGPADRESFFAAQARNRRAAWQLEALCWLAIVLMAVPMAMVVSPPIFGVSVVLLDVVNLLVPTPNLMDALSDQRPWALALALLLPGAVLMVACWYVVRRLFLQGGVGGILLSLDAREPRPDDLEERQLQNVVEEMAVASGVPVPRVLLLEGPGLSAAAVGRGVGDATVVVSRGMLGSLDRDETQGILAHVIASVGNGDLGIAHRIVSMYATVALLQAFAGSGIEANLRGRFLAVVRYAIGRRHDPAEAERVCVQLLDALSETGDPSVLARRRAASSGGQRKMNDDLAAILIMPILLPWALVWMCRMAFLTFLVDPLLTLLWRRRRYLADASAVQLTRHPTGLANALERLAKVEVPLPGNPWASFLFAAGPLRRRGAKPTASFGGRDLGISIDCLPDRSDRIKRLGQMGADVPNYTSRWAGRSGMWRIVGLVLLGPPAAALYIGIFGLLLTAASLLFVFYPMGLMLVIGLPHVLLRSFLPSLFR